MPISSSSGSSGPHSQLFFLSTVDILEMSLKVSQKDCRTVVPQVWHSLKHNLANDEEIVHIVIRKCLGLHIIHFKKGACRPLEIWTQAALTLAALWTCILIHGHVYYSILTFTQVHLWQ